jgi:hypothetical protein
MKHCLSVFVLLFVVNAESLPLTNPCPESVESVTDPSPVNMGKLTEALKSLKLMNHEQAMKVDESAMKDIQEIFDTQLVKTKMEEFFRLLYVIQAHPQTTNLKKMDFDPMGVRQILMIAGVFSDPLIPNQIQAVTVDKSNTKIPKYEVEFSSEATHVPLNNGNGFYGYEEGRCQHTMALIFRSKFSFELKMLKNQNLYAREFEGVDIFGDFGSRGLFDVDLQYVTLKSVEFYKGTKKGEVTAKISREEFKKNDHNTLLRWITKIVSNSSVQPIDW